MGLFRDIFIGSSPLHEPGMAVELKQKCHSQQLFRLLPVMLVKVPVVLEEGHLHTVREVSPPCVRVPDPGAWDVVHGMVLMTGSIYVALKSFPSCHVCPDRPERPWLDFLAAHR